MCNPIMLLSSLLLASQALASTNKAQQLVERSWNGQKYGCRCYADDACWPSKTDWNSLNHTVRGNLIAHAPPGAPCHKSFTGPLGTLNLYDKDECETIYENFRLNNGSTYCPSSPCTCTLSAADIGACP